MPNGRYPAVLAGQNLTAAVLQAFAPYAAWKLGDTARASTIVPSADPDLTVGLLDVNAVYFVQVLLIFTGATANTGDIQVIPTSPSGATSVWAGWGQDTSLAAQLGAVHTGFTFGSNGTSSVRWAKLEGTVFTASSTGAVTITWSQNTSNSTATTMKAGSVMTARRLA